MPPRLSTPCAELRAHYEAGPSSLTLAQRYQCAPTTITTHLRRCGVAVRPARFAATPVPPAARRRLYEQERWSLARITEYFGVSVSSISNARRRYGITARWRAKGEGGGE